MRKICLIVIFACLFVIFNAVAAVAEEAGSKNIPSGRATGNDMLRMISGIVADGYCSASIEASAAVHYDQFGMSHKSYSASNKDIHSCQYIREMTASGCIEAKSCMSYKQWSRRNPGFSQDLPRAEFLARWKVREAELYRNHRIVVEYPGMYSHGIGE